MQSVPIYVYHMGTIQGTMGRQVVNIYTVAPLGYVNRRRTVGEDRRGARRGMRPLGAIVERRRLGISSPGAKANI